jgi:tRNA nucleotidyltransferase/poly(A) polymerase
MHDLFNAAKKNIILKDILPHLPGQTYLVGGCVRDLMLGAVPSDFDLITFGVSMDLARQLGAILGGKAFFMDQERQVARVALNHGDLTIDVSPPRGYDIAADLAERDITINAMALNPFDGTLIDPLGGQKDLQERRIRLIAEKNLKDDPLRGLRCLRFSVQLGFSLDNLTMEVIKKNAETLQRIAPERIKYEFLKVLKCPVSASFFSLLIDAGYAPVLFKAPVDEDRLGLSLEFVSGVERLLMDVPSYLPGIKDSFADELEHGFTRSGALQLAGFFAGMAGSWQQNYNEDLVHSWCARLALSSLAGRIIAKTISGMLLVIGLDEKPFPSGSNMHRLLSAYRQCLPDMLLLALASNVLPVQKITDGTRDVSIQAHVASLWGYFLGTYQVHAASPLLTGHDIMESLSVDPGPKVGELLRLAEEARADGIISSRGQALEYLRSTMAE